MKIRIKIGNKIEATDLTTQQAIDFLADLDDATARRAIGRADGAQAYR